MALGGWRRVARLQGCPDPPPRPSCTGSLVGQRLSDHPDVRKIGFTGSTEVGKHIMRRWVVERAEGPGLRQGTSSGRWWHWGGALSVPCEVRMFQRERPIWGEGWG